MYCKVIPNIQISHLAFLLVFPSIPFKQVLTKGDVLPNKSKVFVTLKLSISDRETLDEWSVESRLLECFIHGFISCRMHFTSTEFNAFLALQ